MRKWWRFGLVLVLAMTLAGCGGQASAGPLAAPVEAAAPLNPKEPSSILMAKWDDTLDVLELDAIDLDNGSLVPGWSRLVLQDGGREVAGYTFTAKGDRLAVLSGTAPFCSRSAGGSACWPGSDHLDVIDLTAHSQESFTIAPTAYVPTLAFSPDGATLALARESREGFSVSLWRGNETGPAADETLTFLPSILEYSTDGHELIALGDHPGEDPGMSEPGPLTVVVLDAETLAILWQQTLDVRHGSWCLEGCGESHEQILFANWTPAIVPLPGSDRIVILHADSDKMTMIDADLRHVETIDIVTARSWLDRLMALGTIPAEAKGGSQGVYRQAVASPDGSRIYAIGREYQAWKNADGMWETSDTALGLQVIDPANGRRLASVESDALRVTLSGDGSWILLNSWLGLGPRTEALGADDLRAGPSLKGWDLQTAHSLAGAPVILATSATPAITRVAAVDPITLGVGQPWSLPPHATLLLP